MRFPKLRPRVGLRASSVILCLTVAVILTTGATFARYSSSVSDWAGARVAKFEVSMNAQGSDITLNGAATQDDEMSGTYGFTVSSNSEVAVEYDIVIEFTKAPPEGLSLQIDDSTVQAADGTTTAFSFDGGTFAPNDSNSSAHTLTVSGNLEELVTDFADTVTVNVYATQID